MAALYPQIKLARIAAVIVSGRLFAGIAVAHDPREALPWMRG